MARRNEPFILKSSFADIPTRPVFSKADSIFTNRYTSGGEYMLVNEDPSAVGNERVQATDYIGYYHSYINGAVYTGKSYSDLSRKLEPYQHTLLDSVIRIDDPIQRSENTKSYRILTERAFHNHTNPILYIPSPGIDVYKNGAFNRHFAQKRNTGELTEISLSAAQSYNNSNAVGLSQFTYYVSNLSWSVTGTAQQVRDANLRVLALAEEDLPGISQYLSDPLEFWRGDDIIDDEYKYTTGGLLRYADGRDYIGFYHILTDGTLKEGVRASSAERATLYRV
jgi:hypothetical protein